MPKMKLVVRIKETGKIVKTFETVYSFKDILNDEAKASEKLDRIKFYTEIIDVDCEHCDGEFHVESNVCNKCGLKNGEIV